MIVLSNDSLIDLGKSVKDLNDDNSETLIFIEESSLRTTPTLTFSMNYSHLIYDIFEINDNKIEINDQEYALNVIND